MVARGAQGLVSRPRRRAVLPPRPSVLADRGDRHGAAFGDGRMASAGVVGAIGGHRADLVIRRDLAEQVRQHGAVALAAGGVDGADARRGRVHRQMHEAPPAAALRPMLASLPFAVAEELDAGAVHEPVERPVRTAVGDLHGQGPLPAAQGRVVRHGQSSPASRSRLATIPAALRERKPEQHLDRQVRAGSPRPRPPPAGRADRHALRARPSLGPPRSAASPAGAGPHCRRTSSSHSSGQAKASSSGPPTCLSPQREACADRALHQRPSPCATAAQATLNRPPRAPQREDQAPLGRHERSGSPSNRWRASPRLQRGQHRRPAHDWTVGAALLEKNDDWALQHRAMQLKGMAELDTPRRRPPHS